jgi:hypothetical protein
MLAVLDAPILLAILVIAIPVAFIVWAFWRTFVKAGLAGPLALLLLIPYAGIVIVPAILAFAKWPNLKNAL